MGVWSCRGGISRIKVEINLEVKNQSVVIRLANAINSTISSACETYTVEKPGREAQER